MDEAHAPLQAASDPYVTEDFESLAPAARLGMRLGGMLIFGVIGLPLMVPALRLIDHVGLETLPAIGLYALVILLLAGFGWWHGGLRWRLAGVRLDGRGIAIRKGVWFRSETFVPRSRIQHTDINRGPIERWLGLATLKLYTAGTRLASIDIGGLDAERAQQLRDALVSHDDDTV